jgi:hypothetical protein
MVGLLETWSNVEVQSVIQFLLVNRVASVEIHVHVVEVKGTRVVSRKEVSICYSVSHNGRLDVDSQPDL